MTSFLKKLVVINGAASGIGRATAKLLASRGALLSLSDIDKIGLAAVKTEVQELSLAAHKSSTNGNHPSTPSTNPSAAPSTVFTYALDVRSQQSCTTWIQETLAHFKTQSIFGAVNSAGVTNLPRISKPSPVREITDEEYDFVFDVNVRGTLNCLRAELPHMLEGTKGRGGGAVVNAASISGLMGLPGFLPYVSSKHAVVGMTRSVAKEEGPRGVRVNAVAPAMIDTPMLDQVAAGLGTASSGEMFGAGPSPAVGRLGDADEVAELIAFLLSPASGFMTGAVVPIDGGLLC